MIDRIPMTNGASKSKDHFITGIFSSIEKTAINSSVTIFSFFVYRYQILILLKIFMSFYLAFPDSITAFTDFRDYDSEIFTFLLSLNLKRWKNWETYQHLWVEVTAPRMRVEDGRTATGRPCEMWMMTVVRTSCWDRASVREHFKENAKDEDSLVCSRELPMKTDAKTEVKRVVLSASFTET